VAFTLHQDGLEATYVSSAATVGGALAGLDVILGTADILTPDADSALRSGLHVYVSYAKRIVLAIDGEERVISTHALTVGDVLEEAGLSLTARDEVSPPVRDPAGRRTRVQVTRVRYSSDSFEILVPHVTFYRDDPAYLRGTETLIQAGADGLVRREFEARYVDGQRVSRELISETLTPPVHRIVARGTAEPPPPTTPTAAPAPPPNLFATADGEVECARTLDVYATWYTAASAGSNTTATGTPVYMGIVAVDPRVIPLGTQMYIPGYGYGLAADTGGGIIGNMVDLGYGPDDAYDWRTDWVDICILG
jgi:3D (Asp-Asp-Asp) domain-containing protein